MVPLAPPLLPSKVIVPPPLRGCPLSVTFPDTLPVDFPQPEANTSVLKQRIETEQRTKSGRRGVVMLNLSEQESKPGPLLVGGRGKAAYRSSQEALGNRRSYPARNREWPWNLNRAGYQSEPSTWPSSGLWAFVQVVRPIPEEMVRTLPSP